MSLLAIVFFAGLLHGIGPDHLAAISVFGSQGRGTRQLTWFSIRFALGHAVVVAIAGLLAKFGRDLLPPAWESGLDVTSGLLLILTGLVMAVALGMGKVTLHQHHHCHDLDGHCHDMPEHLHFMGQGRFAVLLGGFFALGGFRALLAVVPIALAPRLSISILRIGLFTLGIVLAMIGYGLASDTALKRLKHVPAWPGYAIAGFSIVAGLLTLRGHM